jgi:hypothetical protein
MQSDMKAPQPRVSIGENVSMIIGSKQHKRRFLRTFQGSGSQVLIIRVCHVSIVDVAIRDMFYLSGNDEGAVTFFRQAQALKARRLKRGYFEVQSYVVSGREVERLKVLLVPFTWSVVCGPSERMCDFAHKVQIPSLADTGQNDILQHNQFYSCM